MLSFLSPQSANTFHNLQVSVMASDSDSSDGGPLYQALPTPRVPKDFKPVSAPTSAEEYIQHVV